MIHGPRKNVNLLMTLELHEQIRIQALKNDRTVPGYIRQVLKRYLWHVENAPEALTGEWKI